MGLKGPNTSNVNSIKSNGLLINSLGLGFGYYGSNPKCQGPIRNQLMTLNNFGPLGPIKL